MEFQPIDLTSGLGETRLPLASPELIAALDAAVRSETPEAATEEVAASAPDSSLVWATLGDVATTPVRRYAAYRVGYHRGLDALRANGWRGSGYVRSDWDGNLGFLRCLEGLRSTAAEIGEVDEAERVALFLTQLDPTRPTEQPG